MNDHWSPGDRRLKFSPGSHVLVRNKSRKLAILATVDLSGIGEQTDTGLEIGADMIQRTTIFGCGLSQLFC